MFRDERTIFVGKRRVQLEIEVSPFLSKSGAGVDITKISTLDKDNFSTRQFSNWKKRIEADHELMENLQEDAQEYYNGFEREYDNCEVMYG